MKKRPAVFDTSSEVTKKKRGKDINAEPEMIELKRMIRAGELSGGRTVKELSDHTPTRGAALEVYLKKTSVSY